jgi:hypothetical protein
MPPARSVKAGVRSGVRNAKPMQDDDEDGSQGLLAPEMVRIAQEMVDNVSAMMTPYQSNWQGSSHDRKLRAKNAESKRGRQSRMNITRILSSFAPRLSLTILHARS